MRRAANEAGFIMLDALMAVALIALSGTVVAAISIQQLQQQDQVLDRSVALVMLQSIMHQYLALPPSSSDLARVEDERFDYRVLSAQQTVDSRYLVALRVSAQPRSGGEGEHLDFLAPIPLTP